MHPGHDLGQLAADASGDTNGVYLNGRNLTVQEVQLLTVPSGVYWQPGRYWFDAQGNVGYDGNDIPVGNLYVTVRARQQSGALAGGGGGGGGDNSWTSRFSAGNYDPNSGEGYVSVPGYGPVGFGGN